MRKFFDIVTILLFSFAAAGLAVRFTVRDALPAAAWIYYFFGLPVIITGLLTGAAGAALLAGRLRRFVVLILLAASIGGSWWTASRHANPCEVAEDSIRVVSWNVSRLTNDGNEVAAELASLRPDVALLVEGGRNNAEAWEFWRERFPGYDVALPGGGIVVLVRGSIESTDFRHMTGISSYAQFDLIVKGRPLRAVAVDLDASPRFDKRLLVPRVFELAGKALESPLIVGGDFNTPLDSPVFTAVRKDFRHAFEAAGHGLAATWPARFPITAIDHIWTGPYVRPLCTSLYSSDASDHRAVVLDATF